MRSLLRILVLASALLGLTGTALADVSPSIEVRLVSPFVAVNAGDTYEGRLEITSMEIGTLSEFTLTSDGWNASMNNSPSTRAVQVGDVLTIDFTASANDPDKLIEFGCDFNGYPVRYAVDLSEKNVRNMTQGAAVEAVSEFQAIPGDRTYGEMDVLLGGDLTKAADGARYTINVSGRFGAPRNDSTWLPAHSIRIEVWDQDSGSDDLMGTGSTNFDGYYSIDVESTDGDGTGNPDIYVKFIMENSRARCYEPSSGNNYSFVTGVQTNYGGTSLDFGSLQPANPDLHPSVFMHTNATRAWVHDYNLGYDVPACRVEWPSAAWPNCSPSGRIQMRIDFSWRDGTIFHEYGHWFDHEMASWGTWDYCNGVCDNSPTDCGHCFWCQESQAIAWLEGWAQFHGIAISDWYPGYYGLDPLSPVSGETLGTCGGGGYDVPLLTEGFIAALTNDIADGNQDSHGVYGAYTDRLAVGAGPIFAVTALDDPSGSQDFANKFVARYPGWRELFWETAANCGFWFDTTPPGVVTSLNSPSHTAGVASPDPTVFFTWNRASDNYSGIAGYGLFISIGGPGLPSAIMDIGDVTSYTTAALSPGTYYFNIRAVDNAGYWSGSYANWGPIVIREPDPADLVPYLAGGWDYPLVPRTDTDTTTGFAPVAPTLPGDTALTYWNIFGQNLGEAATGSGFWAWLNIDGVNEQTVFWNEINAGGLYYGPNRGPVYVQAGRHSFTSRHDATDLVAETNEFNNVFGRQFIWTPHVVGPDVVASRPSPPDDTGGWDEVTSGVTWYNCDGLQMSTSTGWWHAMAVWADSDDNDFDCRLHAVSTGSEDGFATSLAYSASGSGYLDVVAVNRNQDSTTAWDVGVPVWVGEGSYQAHHAYSEILAFGDSVTVAMGEDIPILLREFYLDAENFGPVSVTASGDPFDGPLELVVLNRDFTHGTNVVGSQVGSASSDGSGLARVSSDLVETGWYGIMVYRNQMNGLAARDVTIEISTTPPDLAAWTPPGWHSGMVPRPALDGTGVWCPAPGMLYPAPNPTYYNVAAQNLGPVPSILPTRVFRDGIYGGYINWGEISSGGTVSYNWALEHMLSSGRHALGLRVDALQEVEETNENNNIVGEQWIWNPDVFAVADADVRNAPPPTTGGWSDVTNGDILWYNCDGLRLEPSISNYWGAMAILPAAGSDYDLRLHEASTGAKSGFGASLVGSFEAGTVTEYLLVDYNAVAFDIRDVGVLDWSGSGNYRAHAGEAPYLGNSAAGDWGPFAVPAGGLIDMSEFFVDPMNYTVTVENLSGADLGLAVHMSGTEPYQNRLNAVGGSVSGGPGEDEAVTFEVTAAEYYCFVVYREDHGTGEAPYILHISNSLSPVGDDNDLPMVTQMSGAYPNPFNPQTTVAFELARDDHARVLIYDLQGRLIRRLVDQALPVGRHTAVWEGRDDSGRAVASGIYFARLEASSGGGMTKLVLVK